MKLIVKYLMGLFIIALINNTIIVPMVSGIRSTSEINNVSFNKTLVNYSVNNSTGQIVSDPLAGIPGIAGIDIFNDTTALALLLGGIIATIGLLALPKVLGSGLEAKGIATIAYAIIVVALLVALLFASRTFFNAIPLIGPIAFALISLLGFLLAIIDALDRLGGTSSE